MSPPSLKTDAKSFHSVEQLEFVFSHLSKRANSGRDAELEARSRELLRAVDAAALARSVRVEWNSRLRSAAGRADFRCALVSLNPRLVDHGDAEIDRTVRHELAHLLAKFRAGRRQISPHGAEWRKACHDLGIANENRCHTLPFPVNRRTRRFIYICPLAVAISRACADCGALSLAFHAVERTAVAHLINGFDCGFGEGRANKRLDIVPFALCRFLSAQLRLDEQVDVAIHDRLHVARLRAGAVIFHHLVRLKNVGANLAAPRHVALLAILPIDLGALFVLLDFVELCLQHLDRELAIAPLAALGLTGDDDPRRLVHDAHRRLDLVHVLPAFAAGAKSVDLDDRRD